MIDTLADSNVLLDIFSKDPQWEAWSSAMLARCFREGNVYINTVIFAEVSIRFERIEEVEAVLPASDFRRGEIPLEAAFLAGKAFLQYRKQGVREYHSSLTFSSAHTPLSPVLDW